MSISSVSETPLTATQINNMIAECMAITAERRSEEMKQEGESLRSIRNEFMVVTLRGMLIQALA